MLEPLRDPQYWLDALHALLHMAVSIPACVVVVTWWAVALCGITSFARDWSIPYDAGGAENQTLPEVLGFADSPVGRVAVYTAVGLVFALTLPIAVRAAALAEAQLAGRC
jgi:putative sensor protein